MPLKLLSAVDLVLVAEGERGVGENVAGMAEQNESGVWGLMLLGLMWWLGWGCTVGEFGSHPCGGVTCLGGAAVFGGSLRAVN